MPISASSWIVLQSSMLHIMVCGYQQIDGYADAPRVEALRQGTTLHKIIMQFKGWETTTLSFITKDAIITLFFITKYAIITLSFITKYAFITLSFITKRTFITLSFSKVNIK